MANCLHPGPQDPSVLELQEYHVSQHVSKGDRDHILRIRCNQSHKHEDPPHIIIPYLE